LPEWTGFNIVFCESNAQFVYDASTVTVERGTSEPPSTNAIFGFWHKLQSGHVAKCLHIHIENRTASFHPSTERPQLCASNGRQQAARAIDDSGPAVLIMRSGLSGLAGELSRFVEPGRAIRN